MFHLYVLQSVKTGRRYAGSCQNVEDRLHRHNAGQSNATRHGVPWKLMHPETFPSRREAMERERFYKTGRGRDELDARERAERSPRRQVAGSNPVTPTISFSGMKTLLFCGALALFIAGGSAQDVAPLPSPEAQGSPTPQPAVTPPPPIIPPGLLALPDGPAPRPQLPTLPELDEGFKPAPLSPEAENQRRHVEWRRLRNAFQNDRDVQAALEAAREARTDLEKRKLLGHYYDLFYGRMIARAAPEMKSYLLDRKREAVGALPQPRVRPGVAMSQTAGVTPSPTVAPKPTPLFRPAGVSDLGR